MQTISFIKKENVRISNSDNKSIAIEWLNFLLYSDLLLFSFYLFSADYAMARKLTDSSKIKKPLRMLYRNYCAFLTASDQKLVNSLIPYEILEDASLDCEPANMELVYLLI